MTTQLDELTEYIEELLNEAYDQGSRQHGLDARPSEMRLEEILGNIRAICVENPIGVEIEYKIRPVFSLTQQIRWPGRDGSEQWLQNFKNEIDAAEFVENFGTNKIISDERIPE